MKWTIIIVGLIVGLIVATLYITDTDYLLKAVRTIYLKGYTTAYLEDYKEFDNEKFEPIDHVRTRTEKYTLESSFEKPEINSEIGITKQPPFPPVNCK